MKKDKMVGVMFFFILCFTIFLSPIYVTGITFTVTNTNDVGAGSLRNAITSANAANGIPDTIDFNISGAGLHTIYPQSQLPQLTDPAGVFINGLTQGGADDGPNPPSSAILLIEINGAQAGASHGLWITSPNNIIQGIVVDSFQQDGIRIQGSPGDGTYNNYIYCNFTGTNPSGTTDWGNGTNALSPWAGINIVVTPGDPTFAFNNTVTKNLSSGNYAGGVSISSCPPGDNHHNTVEYNYLGTDLTGMNDIGNDHTGVYIGEAAHDNLIDSNLISGNGTEGVCILGYVDGETQWYTQHNTVTRNTIGLNVNHSSALQNDREGVSIGKYYGNGPPTDDWQLGFANYNIIGPNNTIAFNGKSGVMVWEHSTNAINADNNQITQNSIYDNGTTAPGYLGIDLADDMVTANDGGDPDTGPNEELNFPVINSAVYLAGNTTISGVINIDTNPTQATVEIFKADPDNTGYGEGRTYLGSATPDGAGNWNATVSGLNPGDSVTATTTDLNLNTSEFSSDYMLPYMIVTSPNGGENWLVGSNQNITWNSSGTSGNVHIEYSINNSSSWSDVIASTTDNGTYSWTIPNTPSDSCLVRVSDTDGSPTDVSDSLFSISTTAASLTVTSPNGGETWQVDSVYNITWTSNGTSGNVYIEYSANNGTGWSFVTASTTDNGTYAWTIPNTPSTNCLVRITDSDGDPTDVSDAVFTITLAPAVPIEKLPTIYSMTAKKTITNKNLEFIYTLPDKAAVTFSVYDITGKIRKKISKEERPGLYSEEIDMSGAPSGIYFIKMKANEKEFINKFLLIR